MIQKTALKIASYFLLKSILNSDNVEEREQDIRDSIRHRLIEPKEALKIIQSVNNLTEFQRRALINFIYYYDKKILLQLFEKHLTERQMDGIIGDISRGEKTQYKDFLLELRKRGFDCVSDFDLDNVGCSNDEINKLKTAAMPSIIKINDGYNGSDNIYEIENTNSVQRFIYFNCYEHGCGYYMVFDKKRKKFDINAINPKLYKEDFKKGIPKKEFLQNLEITNVVPRGLSELQDELTETISFYTLIDIFEKYGFDYVGDREVSNGSQKGLRFELSGNGDYEAMLNEIKEKANYPEKILAGGDGTHRYAPEITLKSVIVLY